MGYFSDQKGIMNRYLRESGAWESHLAKSRQYILDFLKKNKPGKVAILGSGWLLDVPLEELAEFSSELILIDIHHPRQIRHKLRRYSNLVFLDYEISGGTAYEVYDLVKGKGGDLHEIKYPGFKEEIEADYFVSLNILDQLDTLIVDYLKKFQTWPVEDINELRKNIQEAHIESLPKGKSCMITDITEITENMKGEKKDDQLIFAVLPRPKNVKSWLWEFDSAGEYNPGEITYFSVQAMEF
jgi:hypothetical protein